MVWEIPLFFLNLLITHWMSIYSFAIFYANIRTGRTTLTNVATNYV